MDVNKMSKCPWGCSAGQDEGFSEAQAFRDTITVKVLNEYVTKDIIQCPYCGKRVKRHRHGWIRDEGVL